MNRRKSKERAKREADQPLSFARPAVGIARTRTRAKNAGASPGKTKMRRIVRRHDLRSDFHYDSTEPWEWKATQRPPAVVRAENRRRNRRQRAARKANR